MILPASPVGNKSLRIRISGEWIELIPTRYRNLSVHETVCGNRQGIQQDRLNAFLGCTDSRSGKDDARADGPVKGLRSMGTAVSMFPTAEEIVSFCDRVTVLRNGEVAGSLIKNKRFKGPSDLYGGKRLKKPMDTMKRPKTCHSISSFSWKPGDRLESLTSRFQRRNTGYLPAFPSCKTAMDRDHGICPSGGSVILHGKALHANHPLKMIKKNIWMLPEDRRGEGLLADHSIMENMTFTAIQTQKNIIRKTPVPFISFPDE